MDHQIQAVRLMQDYIKDHIHEDISIDDRLLEQEIEGFVEL